MLNKISITNSVIKKFLGLPCIHSVGLKYISPPIKYESKEKVERPKLRIMEKVPQYPPNLRAPKMQKKLNHMRGPEKVHNKLLHQQYGIIATGGGRLRSGHFEMLRLTIGRKMNVNRMFAVWRVPAPWQPVTKKGQGQRMGGGKGSVDHYVTPVKSGRVILEIGGQCEMAEVKPFLQQVANQLPFKAMVVSWDMIEKSRAETARRDCTHIKDFSLKYVIQNNLNGCHKWLSPVDYKWFGKYA
ncbi:39S ribosomal protein L16, mitochondrial-like [Teleopsis dalmanni]|uniref:39S ribosomal protein L16, mitochondrial-like n=1 Tax=Teleopsis dalmanni TaxID=139649 RepID=UPI0018CD00CF|nr:39S ribosomal protein L16, mitochondrial-like [Teleopsis dalmanni]XP_037960493.1 39S ribosomal protein L16, mitochondrial-like [Teleopsis dalmanni]